MEKRCEELMKADKVVLFMKGDRDTPRCGFSQKFIAILEKEGYEYSTFDILGDESVRQSTFTILSSTCRSAADVDCCTELKQMNDWPTFPQLIVNGEFMGGLDVVVEMVETGELAQVMA